MLRYFTLFPVLFVVFGLALLANCQSSSTAESTSRRKDHTGEHRLRYRDQVRRQEASRLPTRQGEARVRKTAIPTYVYDVLDYVRANNRPMAGYVGGRRFGNFEQHLPRSAVDGKPIRYQEWDVNPKRRGVNRGTQRLVTGSDGRAWYTDDHYATFTQIAP